MSVREEIINLLETQFSPTYLDVVDESHKHQGHKGWKEGGETHFCLFIEAESLNKQTAINRHRAIHETLSDLLDGPIHALSIRRAPSSSN